MTRGASSRQDFGASAGGGGGCRRQPEVPGVRNNCHSGTRTPRPSLKRSLICTGLRRGRKVELGSGCAWYRHRSEPVAHSAADEVIGIIEFRERKSVAYFGRYGDKRQILCAEIDVEVFGPEGEIFRYRIFSTAALSP